MFRRASSTQNKIQKPEAGDENVRAEAQAEERNSIQPMGNEAANTELMDQMLKEAKKNNILDLDEYIDEDEDGEEDIVPVNDKKRRSFIESDADDPDNSMYLNSSHNIVNENNMRPPRDINNLIRNESGSEDSEDDENIIINPPKKAGEKKNKKKADRKDAEKALEIAEKIVEKAPEKKQDAFPAISAYAPDADLIAEKGRGKTGRKIKGKKAPGNILNAPEETGTDISKGIEDARWKEEAIERLKKVELENATREDTEQFRADEMAKIRNWDFDAQKLDPVNKKPKKKKSFLTYLAGGMGKLLSLALEVLTLGHFWRAKSTARFLFTDTDKWQLTKDYQNIPGWNGAKFDPGQPGEKMSLLIFAGYQRSGRV